MVNANGYVDNSDSVAEDTDKQFKSINVVDETIKHEPQFEYFIKYTVRSVAYQTHTAQGAFDHYIESNCSIVVEAYDGNDALEKANKKLNSQKQEDSIVKITDIHRI